MTNTNWRSLAALPVIAFGCCAVASAHVATQSLPSVATHRAQPFDSSTLASAAGTSCYGTLEGFLKCVDKPSPPPPPPKKS